MNGKLLLVCSVIVNAGLFSLGMAMRPTPPDLHLGDLSQVYRDRTLPMEQPTLWLGAQASHWTGRQSPGPEISFSAAGVPFPLPAGPISNAASAQNALKTFAQQRLSAWGNLSGCDLVPWNARQFRGVWHVTLIQTYQGIPVFGSRFDGKIRQDGFLLAVSARLFDSAAPNLSFGLSAEAALRRLSDDPSAHIEFARQVLYPQELEGAQALRPAWQLRAGTDQPDLRPAGIVDAQTGDVLLRYNDVSYDAVSGQVLGLVLPAYWNDPPQAWPQKNQWVNIVTAGVVYTDSTGDYSLNGLPAGDYTVQGKLQGLYVDVNNDDGPDAFFTDVANTSAPLDWTWDYDLARQDEINVYYHVNLVHAYFKGLDSSITGLDYPLPATVGYGSNYENAFWGGDGIYFGAGGSTFHNFALFSDVIYHEYGHGITDMIYPEGMLPYEGQPGAMNEGWSDYFACSITNEPLIGEGLYNNSSLPLRNLDNDLRYPQNWTGEVHADGRIFGGALWDLRQLVGAGVADSVIHFARYALAELWEDYFVDVLVTDDDDGNLSNGGPHHPEIYQAFGQHGIGPGAEPQLAINMTELLENGAGGSQGNGDGFYDPGEVLSMTFSVSDSRYLYPPPATDVTVTVSAEDADLIFEPQTFNLGQIAPGATVQAQDSLLIQVAPQANLSFTHIIFQISANGGSYQISDSIEIIIGHPLTVLVDDDGGANFQQYLDSSLRQSGQVFSLYNVAAQGPISLNILNQYQAAIWMTGNDSVNTLTASDQTALAAYLNSGHDLMLTGQNLVEDIGSTPFFANYLKCQPLAGDINDYSLDGVSGDPISDSTWVLILGASAAGNQTSPAAIAALPGAYEIYHYHADPTHRPGAVRYDSGIYKVVTFAFGCEAISGLGGSAPRPDVLTSVLAWFGLPTAVEPQPPGGSVPTSLVLGQPFPNPFNSQTAIPLRLPQPSRVRVELYNLRGQALGVIFDATLDAGSQTIHWDASQVASGMYFLKVGIRDQRGAVAQSTVSKVLLIK